MLTSTWNAQKLVIVTSPLAIRAWLRMAHLMRRGR